MNKAIFLTNMYATLCFATITSSAEHPNPSELGEPQKAWCQPILGPGLKVAK